MYCSSAQFAHLPHPWFILLGRRRWGMLHRSNAICADCFQAIKVAYASHLPFVATVRYHCIRRGIVVRGQKRQTIICTRSKEHVPPADLRADQTAFIVEWEE